MDIKDRPIINPIFSPLLPTDLKFNDLVVVYNDGEKWKVIPHSTMQKCLIIHDYIYSYMDQINKTKATCTLTYCPYTQSVVLYKKHLTLSETQDEKNLLLIDSDTNKTLSQLAGNADNSLIKDDVYRDTLKNIIREFRDSLYLRNDVPYGIFGVNTKNLNSILCHGIEYISKTVDKNGKQKKKYIMILHPNKPIKKLLQYMRSLNTTITEKDGILIPSTKGAWETYFSDSKVVIL